MGIYSPISCHPSHAPHVWGGGSCGVWHFGFSQSWLSRKSLLPLTFSGRLLFKKSTSRTAKAKLHNVELYNRAAFRLRSSPYGVYNSDIM
ncbi:MAG: hypothetical protein U5M51_14365 [Emticicia sp.]|nr:hypothetical protein [Emticicia sp.]